MILAPPKWSSWTPWAAKLGGKKKCGTMLRYRAQENCNKNECLKENQARFVPCE